MNSRLCWVGVNGFQAGETSLGTIARSNAAACGTETAEGHRAAISPLVPNSKPPAATCCGALTPGISHGQLSTSPQIAISRPLAGLNEIEAVRSRQACSGTSSQEHNALEAIIPKLVTSWDSSPCNISGLSRGAAASPVAHNAITTMPSCATNHQACNPRPARKSRIPFMVGPTALAHSCHRHSDPSCVAPEKCLASAHSTPLSWRLPPDSRHHPH